MFLDHDLDPYDHMLGRFIVGPVEIEEGWRLPLGYLPLGYPSDTIQRTVN